MHLTKALFSAEEAFSRIGQTREAGCLAIVSGNGAARLFTRDGCVIYATSDGKEGPEVLKECFSNSEASYVWIPEVKPPRESMRINITGHALENAIARDIHISKTTKVSLASPDRPNIPEDKRLPHYFLVGIEKPHEKLPMNKPTVIVGRDHTCEIVVTDLSVSRRHCLLQAIPRGLSFRDLESSNGTFVNDLRATDGFIQPGDRLTLGHLSFTVHRETK